MEHLSFESPIGWLTLTADGGFIVSLEFRKSKHTFTDGKDISPVLLDLHSQLREYFEGKRKSFNFNRKPSGTAFQNLVWNQLTKIPYGKSLSYGELAKKIENPKAQRAVGMANNKNRLPILIPCHRVIGKDGSLIGYAGGISIKEYLLHLEKNSCSKNPNGSR